MKWYTVPFKVMKRSRTTHGAVLVQARNKNEAVLAVEGLVSNKDQEPAIRNIGPAQETNILLRE